LTIENGFFHHDPFIATTKIFPPNWYFKPWDLSKSQYYYMIILEIIGSTKFKHFKLQQNYSQYVYFTCIIQNILHFSDWKQPLLQTIQFPISYDVKLSDFIACSYSYSDYQQAWFDAFFLQNSKGSHSWLFYFNNFIMTSNLPNRFLQWWDYFDCIYKVIKPHLSIEITTFISNRILNF
jgi:hypothetical protein